MNIIASASYVVSELQAEVGRLPPTMLPLANKRLYQWQVKALRLYGNSPIVVTLPESYELKKADENWFTKNDIQIIKISEDLTLGQSIKKAIEIAIKIYGRPKKNIRIVYGDTFINTIPHGDDILAVSKPIDSYLWEHETINKIDTAWIGYYSFSNIDLLCECISSSKNNFIDGVRSYAKNHPLKIVIVDDWLDFGHVNTFFRSRSAITTQRSFNSLQISGGIVKKESSNSRKIAAEAEWFRAVPQNIKLHLPQLLGFFENKDRAFYELEYLPLLPLNELWVHCEMEELFWQKINSIAGELLNKLQNEDKISNEIKREIYKSKEYLVIEKTKHRILEIQEKIGIPINKDFTLNGEIFPSIIDISLECQQIAMNTKPIAGIMHGDFCFSNILFDPRANQLKLIDPRGLIGKNKTIYGDLNYDIAKFSHSIVGFYDFIIAGAYKCKAHTNINYDFEILVDKKITEISNNYLKENYFFNKPGHENLALVILLFITMIPLHSESPKRQQAFISNAYRLYKLMKSK